MNTPDAPDRLAQRARATFDGACDALDAAAANRLRIARRAALAGPSTAQRWRLAPLAGAIAVAIAAFVAWPRSPARAPAPIAGTPHVRPAPAAIATPGPVAPEAVSPRPPADAGLAQTEPAPDDTSDHDASDDNIGADDALADVDPDLDALGEDDAELYAWLAGSPVAPDAGGDAL